jgi:hypothetical protein
MDEKSGVEQDGIVFSLKKEGNSCPCYSRSET